MLEINSNIINMDVSIQTLFVIFGHFHKLLLKTLS